MPDDELPIRELLKSLLGPEGRWRTTLRQKCNDFVFAYPDGWPFDPSTVVHRFGKTLRQAGILHLCFYDLRNTHTTFLLGAGVNAKVVSERLGHTSVAFTMDACSPGMQGAAADCLDALVVPSLGRMESAGKTLIKC